MGIERGPLWSSYARLRHSISKTSDILKKMEKGSSKMTISKTERAIEIIQTMRRRMEAGPLGARFMKTLALDTSRNETVLWHGAPREGARDAHGKLFPDSASPLEAIKTHGFD